MEHHRDLSFIVRASRRFAAPLARLVERPLTWREDFFVRNHGAIPDLSLDGWRLSIEGLVATPMTLTLAELVTRFPRRDAVVTLQCAGNRRDELIGVKEIPGEVPWGAEAVRRGVLAAFAAFDGASHIWFGRADAVTRHGHVVLTSIDWRGARGDVLLADR
jgi:sulfite oxidase